METELTTGHSKDSEIAMQRSEKRSNDENCIASNEEGTSLKRLKNVAIGTDSDNRIEVIIIESYARANEWKLKKMCLLSR